MNNYTWSRGFYSEGEDVFTLREALKWNVSVFKNRLKRYFSKRLCLVKGYKRYFADMSRNKYRYALFAIMPFVIEAHLRMFRGYSSIKKIKSNRSESIYLLCFYKSFDEVKIRISMHPPTKNDNSDIFVLI